MIVDNIERNIDKYKNTSEYADKFIMERDNLLMLKDSEHEKKIVKLNKLFISFDKLYDIVNRLSMEKKGDRLLEGIFNLTRNKSKKGNTVDYLSSLIDIMN